jgi:hypothetical protein
LQLQKQPFQTCRPQFVAESVPFPKDKQPAPLIKK